MNVVQAREVLLAAGISARDVLLPGSDERPRQRGRAGMSDRSTPRAPGNHLVRVEGSDAITGTFGVIPLGGGS